MKPKPNFHKNKLNMHRLVRKRLSKEKNAYMGEGSDLPDSETPCLTPLAGPAEPVDSCELSDASDGEGEWCERGADETSESALGE